MLIIPVWRRSDLTYSLQDFFTNAFSSLPLFITCVLTLAVVLVNGWTDAPNAIATAISTRVIKPRNAIILASVFNFLGVFAMTIITPKVAVTISNMVDFGDRADEALIALCAALVAIVIWATAAWYFGIPTSESHALIAGLSGAAIAISGGIHGINGSEWAKVLYGLAISTLVGFALGFIIVKLIGLLFRRADRRHTRPFFRGAQITGAAMMAFMHGAQDGQKFIGVFLLGMWLSSGKTGSPEFEIPIWLMILCSLVMALGTSIGGYRIIKAVGMDMVKLEVYQGFSADLAGALCLLMSSMGGIPVSTTHTKTAAIMGVGAAKRLSSVNWGIVREMVLTWILTFPGCGLIGFLIARLFIAIF
jgi:PiT family inorganic phosphate transporter